MTHHRTPLILVDPFAAWLGMLPDGASLLYAVYADSAGYESHLVLNRKQMKMMNPHYLIRVKPRVVFPEI